MNRRLEVGEVRPSQLLHTYGVGAVIDLPHLSVMVMGLDDWDFSQSRPVVEERLLARVCKRLGPQVEALRTPPLRQDVAKPFFRTLRDGDPVGVPVAPFPRFMRCPRCDHLAPLASGIFALRTVPGRPDRARYIHLNCNQDREPTALPARFLFACERGHLDDFPWRWFVHRGKGGCNGALLLHEMGVSGEASEVLVECGGCDAKRTMAEAFGKEASRHLPACRGRRPQLREFEEEPCEAARRAILVGASNIWFAVTLRLLHVPVSADDRIGCLVEDNWDKLASVKEASDIAFMRRRGEIPALGDMSNEQLLAAIERRRDGIECDDGDLKGPEWKALATRGCDLDIADFRMTEVEPPDRFSSVLTRVRLVDRIREVTALTHFTRIASPRDYAAEEPPGSLLAPLSRTPPRFVPANDIRGEGLFLQWNEKRIASWERKQGAAAAAHLAAHTAWRRRRRIEPPEDNFPGIRFILLHSFAHALMRELALECGYAAASLRERIYSRAGGDGESMAGILIYTAAPDSEGTLAGLVRTGRPEELARHIDQALTRMGLCSSDPLCADHRPDADGSTLHGAACHACLFAPETSCEAGNKYLDRTLLVRTVAPAGAAFFALESL